MSNALKKKFFFEIVECWHVPRITTCSNKLITLSKFCLVYLDSSPETQIRLAGFEGGPVQ